MAKAVGTVVIDKEVCKGCGVCVNECPNGVLALHKEVNSCGYHYVYMKEPENCIGCANCGIVCPDSCVTVYRAKN